VDCWREVVAGEIERRVLEEGTLGIAMGENVCSRSCGIWTLATGYAAAIALNDFPEAKLKKKKKKSKRLIFCIKEKRNGVVMRHGGVRPRYAAVIRATKKIDLDEYAAQNKHTTDSAPTIHSLPIPSSTIFDEPIDSLFSAFSTNLSFSNDLPKAQERTRQTPQNTSHSIFATPADEPWEFR
jgi:hypothetical protein